MQLMKLVTTTLGIILLSYAQTVAGKELNFSMSVNGMGAVGTSNNVVVTFFDKYGKELYKETREGLEDRWKFHVFRTGELSDVDVYYLGHIQVQVEGDDGLVIDYAWVEARIIGEPPSNEKIATWGVYDEKGWCLSTDPGDANLDIWSGHLVADQCKPGYDFVIDPKMVDISEHPTRPCIGVDACKYSDVSYIRSKSCHGHSSCIGAQRLNVYEGSCRGDFSCARLESCFVAEGSCIGNYACANDSDGRPYRYSRMTFVSEGSCVGERACENAGDGVRIDKNSCNCIGCCGYCKDDAIVPENACNMDENGVPVNPDDFIDGKCKYCVDARKNVEDEL